MRNVGGSDRGLRALAGAGMLLCSVMAPLSLVVRMTTFGVMGAYLLFTALVGTCLGYRLMGKSTCPNEAQR